MDVRYFEINGHDFKVVRSVINAFSWEYYDTRYRLGELDLSLSVSERDKLIRTLYERGYLEKADAEQSRGCSYPYNLMASEEGRRLACKPLAKRKTKKEIDKKLQSLLNRASDMVKLPFLKYEVDKIAIFGSYLNEDNKDFGDLGFICSFRYKSDYTCIDNIPAGIKANSLHKISELVPKFNKVHDVYTRVMAGELMHHDGLLDYRPLGAGNYMVWYLDWDYRAAKYHLVRRDKLLSMCDIGTVRELNGVSECLVVFDVDKGGICTAYKLDKFKF